MSETNTSDAEAFNLASMKRQISQLKDELERTTGSHGKKRTSPDQSLARGGSRLVSMFDPFQILIAEFDRRLAASTAPAAHEDVDPAVQREQDRRYNSYKLLVALLPKLEEQLMDTDVDATNAYVASIQKAANEARGDDIRRVKEELACWLNELHAMHPASVNAPFSPKSRIDRGLQNYITGGLLCPVDLDWDNEIIRTGIRNCDDGLSITDNFFITCLYPFKFRTLAKLDLEEDFLRGHLLRKAFAVIFKSPSSAEGITATDNEAGTSQKKQRTDKHPKATRGNVATLLRMDGKVTARSIAYAATLLVFNLSDASQWPADGIYNGFDYHAFYNFIVDYFEVTDAESEGDVAALLSWWSKSMFPEHATSKHAVNTAWKQLIHNRGLRQRARNEALAAAAAAAVTVAARTAVAAAAATAMATTAAAAAAAATATAVKTAGVAAAAAAVPMV